jgi:hypothetical protein
MINRPIRSPIRRPIVSALAPSVGGSTEVTEAPVVILLGQSLAAPRGTAVATGTIANGVMPVGGASIQNWLFYSTSSIHVGHWDELASSATFQETDAQSTGQTPLYGILSELLGAGVNRAYVGAAAIPGVQLVGLNNGGPLANLWAMLMRLCALAREAGYTPKVYFYSAHGEANAAAGTSRASYFAQAKAYYQLAQLYAAWAMESPSYVAPVFLTYMAQRSTPANVGTNERNICLAIRDLAEQVPGCYDLGGITQWPISSDRVHPTEAAYVQRGEWVGRMIRQKHLSNTDHAPLRITACTLSGTTFVATWSHAIVRDAASNVGGDLNTANQEDGLEWWDNGSQIAISPGSLVYGANTITGTLASSPTGTLAQQELRVAMMGTPIGGALWPGATPGSNIRRNETGFASQWVSGYQHYTWASPQVFAGVV